MSTNEYQAQNRLKKALRLSFMLDRLGVDAEKVKKYSDAQWKLTALMSGCSEPHSETRELTVVAMETLAKLRNTTDEELLERAHRISRKVTS